MAEKNRLDTLTAFLQQQGFVWGPSPEIYGGMAGFYTYAPLGAMLKRNVEARIRKVFAKKEIFEVETPTILPAAVWEASGHLGGFTDPLIKDEKGAVWRADKLIEEYYKEAGITTPVPVTDDEMIAELKKHNIKPPSGENLVWEITAHSLMMKTTVGTDQESYNRPETATATYLPFNRYAEFFRQKLPFGVFQIGRAYRNEISPRNHLLRLREFTQAEAQIFLSPYEKNNFDGYEKVKDAEIPLLSWRDQEQGKQATTISLAQAREDGLFGSDAYAYTVHLAYELFRSFGIPEERIRMREHGSDEKAFYAADAWDVEVDIPTFGWTECCGVHDRTNYDLTQHGEASGKKQTMYLQEQKEHVVPHVLEIAFGVDRPVFAILDIFYNPKDEDEGKTIFEVPYGLAPIQVTVLPLTKKLSGKAREVFEMLIEQGLIATYDESSSVGKRYLRASTVGTPYCVTVDFDTLEDDSVTIRDRDTEEQERIRISDLADHLKKLF